ncbi:hypothetical protein Celaphus_00001749 [Cervus elaphus hippelaphus]|uniref:Uncharacterized protein n=1 Tax=Cervus elaphus hippelaphus TaxID=46360 RepID=A0A212CG23_CEREH|nr:hypothetical protein Celaphus_00001749 [Cervus elaphus hippelaphus]
MFALFEGEDFHKIAEYKDDATSCMACANSISNRFACGDVAEADAGRLIAVLIGALPTAAGSPDSPGGRPGATMIAHEALKNHMKPMATGMRGAFGKPQGTVARVHTGQVIMSIHTKLQNKGHKFSNFWGHEALGIWTTAEHDAVWNRGQVHTNKPNNV